MSAQKGIFIGYWIIKNHKVTTFMFNYLNLNQIYIHCNKKQNLSNCQKHNQLVIKDSRPVHIGYNFITTLVFLEMS